VLVLWLHAATGGTHYFFFALQALQVPQVQAFFAFDFGPLPNPGSPFFLPHPHAAHIYLLTFFLGLDFGTPFAGTQFGTFLPFFIFIPTWV